MSGTDLGLVISLSQVISAGSQCGYVPLRLSNYNKEKGDAEHAYPDCRDGVHG